MRRRLASGPYGRWYAVLLATLFVGGSACGGGHRPPSTEPATSAPASSPTSPATTPTLAPAPAVAAAGLPSPAPVLPPGPPPATRVPTAEQSDLRLAAALSLVAGSPTTANHLLAAQEYIRLRIYDQAHEHLTAAIDLDEHNAAAWEARARVWRDAGFMMQALTDAHRAVYLAPRSASAHNTLGTILIAVGRAEAARRQFDEALRLDPAATHVLNNRCYALLVEGSVTEAVAACRRAVDATPELPEARNNLALAFAAQGDLESAAMYFSSGGDEAAAAYNLGLVYYSRRQFDEAACQFERAAALRPAFTSAVTFARHARRLTEQAQVRADRERD